MKRITRGDQQFISLVLVLLISLVGWASQRYPGIINEPTPIAPTGTYRVIGFSDGDTIRVNLDGQAETIRLIGVDTPETKDPRKPVQCFGAAASAFTKQLIGTQPVHLMTDALTSNRDRYNRLLRYVYLPDNRLVQAEIIKAGYGFAYTNFPFTKSSEFLEYQTTAREQNKGLWAGCSPTPNQQGGFTSNDAY